MAGLYIHIPFCEKKCFYCDFYSIAELTDVDRFIDFLCFEIKKIAENFEISHKIESIFLGGGTPSILEIEHLEKVLNAIADLFSVEKDAEITIECNPGTLSKEKLDAYRNLQYNRLSLGVQSFIDSELQFLKRIHNTDDIIESYDLARACGFDNINFDLMFSLPVQSLKSWEYTLKRTIELAPEHISAYSLIYEPNTPLSKEVKSGKIKPHTNDVDSEFYSFTMQYLESAGYNQYEVANYCIDNKKCRHNLNYWYGGEYIGCGPSAHSFINSKRHWNTRNIQKYCNMLSKGELPIENFENLSLKNQLYETILLQLRAEGIIREKFTLNFGFDPVIKDDVFSDFINNELIIIENDKLRLTKKGYLVCDEIVMKLISIYEKISKARG